MDKGVELFIIHEKYTTNAQHYISKCLTEHKIFLTSFFPYLSSLRTVENLLFRENVACHSKLKLLF